MWPVNVDIATSLHLSHTGSTSGFQDLSSSDHQHGSNPIVPNYVRPMIIIVPRPPSITNALEINERSPEKRKRTPTLYNEFIKEDIQRIKVSNPNINHKEAFITAAKNCLRQVGLDYTLQKRLDDLFVSHGTTHKWAQIGLRLEKNKANLDQEGASCTGLNMRPQSQDIKKRTPQDKSQRIPTLYNRFIKEEIQMIKARNPNIRHKEAFRIAAKSWAHFPHIQKLGLWLEHFPHNQKVGTKLENNEHHLNLDESQAGLCNPSNDKA